MRIGGSPVGSPKVTLVSKAANVEWTMVHIGRTNVWT